MIHTNRIVTVGEQESIIDRPIVLYRGDREVEIEFTLVGNEFTFSEEGNVIKSVNASHGQLVLNTPSGEHMFSELAECHEGKVVFVVTKEMIDEFIEMGFYSFQIRLYDSAEMKSRVTIPPVMNGFDIRNPIAAEDETNVVDQGIVDYARIFKDQSNEELPMFTWDGEYIKTEWAHHDVITENKMNKIEDALYSINANIKESDVVMLNTLDQVKKDADAYVKEHMAEVEADVEEFERNLNTDIQQFKIDTNAAMTAHKNEVSEELEYAMNKIYYLNIIDFINGNDITDALNSAINTVDENGEIVIPTGNYIISSTITVNKPLTIKCYGVIQRANDMNGSLFSITSNNVILDNFTIDGNSDNQTSDDDCIVIYNASYCTIKNASIYNVRGNGILVLKSSNNIIENNVLDNIKYNAIFIANKGSDKNRIVNNTIKSTILQNAIFLTASGDSTATEDYIYDNIVKSNIVYSAGDTNIETGIHTVGTIISDNIVYIKNLPGILLRDAKNIIVCNNTVNALDGATTDGIAIVQQTEPMTFTTNSSIINNKLIGYFPRSGIFINQSSVIVSSNSIENSVRGICVAGSNQIIISDNFIKNNTYGIDLNYAAGIQELNNIKINNNFIENNKNSINFYNTTLNNSNISNNTIKDSRENVFVFVDSKGVNSYIKGNIITPTNGYTTQLNGFDTDIFKSGRTMNAIQYGATLILPKTISSLHLKINIYIKEDRSTYGEFYVKDNNIYLLKNNSSNLKKNNTDFSGWSILFDDSQQLIMQRRGESLNGVYTLAVEYECI